jgi:serine/threonine protein kinase
MGKRKQKGGMRITSAFAALHPGATREQLIERANSFYAANSTFRLLSNSSWTSIVFISTLNEGIDAPARSIRATNLFIPIRRLIWKFSIGTTQGRTIVPVAGRQALIYHGTSGLQINTVQELQGEVDIQREIFYHSMTQTATLLEPLCPDILSYATIPGTELPRDRAVGETYQQYITYLGSHNCGTLRTFPGLTPDAQIQFNNIIDVAMGNPHRNLSIITMELLDGYRTVTEALGTITPAQRTFMFSTVQYAFRNLNRLGYYHGDSHTGNIMVDFTTPHWFVDPTQVTCKVIIIDFGSAVRFTGGEIQVMHQNSPDAEEIYHREAFYNYPIMPGLAGGLGILATPQHILTRADYEQLRARRLNFQATITYPAMRALNPWFATIGATLTAHSTIEEIGQAVEAARQLFIQHYATFNSGYGYMPGGGYRSKSKKIEYNENVFSNRVTEDMDPSFKEIMERGIEKDNSLTKEDIQKIIDSLPITEQLKTMSENEFTTLLHETFPELNKYASTINFSKDADDMQFTKKASKTRTRTKRNSKSKSKTRTKNT